MLAQARCVKRMDKTSIYLNVDEERFTGDSGRL
jgi:hypothetical protein